MNASDEDRIDSDDGDDWGKAFDSSNLIRNRDDGEKQASIPFQAGSKDTSKKDEICHPKTIVHIDVDCFYAQVEMIRDPSLRHIPLGIQQKNIIVTCNYEARKYGVSKLSYIADAMKKCPQLVLVSGEDLTHYREMSYKITDHLTKYSKIVERLGFDENYVDVSDMIEMPPWNTMIDHAPVGHIYGYSNERAGSSHKECACGCKKRLTIGTHIAQEIRKSLFQELQITCCAGVAYNKLLAKMVGSFHKPNQQTVIFNEDVPLYMSRVDKVRNIPGIGRKCSQRLENIGVTTVDHLQDCEMQDLVGEFGEEMALNLRQLSRGQDNSEVVITGQPQSLSDEDSFKKCDNLSDAKAKIYELMESLLKRLVMDGRIPQTLRVTVRKYAPGEQKYYSASRQSRQAPIPSLVFRNFHAGNQEGVLDKLMALALKLFYKSVDISKPFHLTLLNLCFSNLVEPGTSGRNTIDSFFKSKSDTTPDSERKIPVEPKVPGEESSGWESERIPSCSQVQMAPQISKNTPSSNSSTQEKIDGIDSRNNARTAQTQDSSKVEVTHKEERRSKENEVPRSKQNHSKAELCQFETENVSGILTSEKDRVKTGKIDNFIPLNGAHCERKHQNVALDILNESIRGFDAFEKTSLKESPMSQAKSDSQSPDNKAYLHETTNSSIESLSKLLPHTIDTKTFLELPCDIQRDLLVQANFAKSRVSKIMAMSNYLSSHKEVSTHTLHGEDATRYGQTSLVNTKSNRSYLESEQSGCESRITDKSGCEEEPYVERSSSCENQIKPNSFLDNVHNVDNVSDNKLSTISQEGHCAPSSSSYIKVSPKSKQLLHKQGDIELECSSKEASKPVNNQPSSSVLDKSCNTKVRSEAGANHAEYNDKTLKEHALIRQCDKSLAGTSQKVTLSDGKVSESTKVDCIPADIDKDVFAALPIDMQKTMVAEWKAKQEFQSMKKRKLSASPDSKNKSGAKRKSGNILTFFNKK